LLKKQLLIFKRHHRNRSGPLPRSGILGYNEPESQEVPMSMDDFTETVIIRGEECMYDPNGGIAILQCEKCGHMNHVEVEVVDGEARFYGFSCENCGTFNSAD
jgi:hypothetical protein